MYKLGCLVFTALTLFSCASQNPQTPAATSNETPINVVESSSDSVLDGMTLPGIDRSVFSDDLSSQALLIQCAIDKTGAYYREQSDTSKMPAFNYIRGEVKLPTSSIIRIPDENGKKDKDGNLINYRIVPTVYTGGDTLNPGGALDAGFNADDRLKNGNDKAPATYWRAFVKKIEIPSIDHDKTDGDGLLYRIKGGDDVKFVVYIDENSKIHLVVRAVMYVFTSEADRNPISKTVTREIVVPSNSKTWSYNGKDQVAKLMTSVAVDRASDMSSDKALEFPPAVYSYVRIGFKDKVADKQDSLDKIIDIQPKQLVDWSAVSYTQTGNPCSAPADMVTPMGSDSAKISFRVKSRLSFSLTDLGPQRGKTNDILYSNFQIKNIGPAGSILYYDTSPKGMSRLSGKLTPNMPLMQGKIQYKCKQTDRVAYQTLDVFYSENETLTNNTQPLGLNLITPPAGLKSYAAAPGNLLFKKEDI